MSTRAVHENIKMAEIPIPYSERLGRSKLSVVHDGRIFLQSMVWTALTYNPVRILGLMGVGGVGVAALVAIGLLITRLNGITALSELGVAAVFAALVSAVAGISLFSLGVTFNYLVTIFHKQPMRQGLFGKPIFKTPLNHQFGWMGTVSFIAGLALGIASLALGISSGGIERLWLYLVGSAMMILIGVQLIISWILLRVLEDLGQREVMTKKDIAGAAIK